MYKLPVTQADRDAAADILTSPYDGSPIQGTQDMIRSGKLDGHHWVQAFAAHRLDQIKALENPTPALLNVVVEAFESGKVKPVHARIAAALAAAAAHLFAENANESTEQFAQNANCPSLKGQI